MATCSPSQDREALTGGESTPPPPWWKSLPYMTKGDLDAFISLTSNNLSTVLVGTSMIMVNDEARDAVYQYMIPAFGVSMVFGLLFYVVQAQLTASALNRTDMCAQPFGINTPGVFAFNSAIIFPVLSKTGSFKTAWQVGVLANLIQGLIEIVMATIGPYVAQVVPMTSLLGSLASVGLAFLFTAQLQAESFTPIVTYVPIYLMMLATFSKVSIPGIPSTLLPVLFGTVAAWITGLSTVDNLKASTDELGWHPCGLLLEMFDNIDQVGPYVNIALPCALVVSVGTIQCRELAANAGDPYNLRWSMFGDGFATVIAALFGSPYGMTVYIGHPAFKQMGAKIGYNILTAIAILLLSFSGSVAVIQAFIPDAALAPILLFIGLDICSEALGATVRRHWPAYIVALVPGMCNWCVQQAQAVGRILCTYQSNNCPGGKDADGKTPCDCLIDTDLGIFTQDDSLRGLLSLSSGYMLSAIFLSAMLIFVIDREFLKAAIWALVSAVCASVGLVHSDVTFLPWRGPPACPLCDQDRLDLHIDFTIAYSMLAVVFFLFVLLQNANIVPKGPPKEVDNLGLDEQAREDNVLS